MPQCIRKDTAGQGATELAATPNTELSRTALRPWRGDNLPHLAEAAKRSRLERLVRPQAVTSDPDADDAAGVHNDAGQAQLQRDALLASATRSTDATWRRSREAKCQRSRAAQPRYGLASGHQATT